MCCVGTGVWGGEDSHADRGGAGEGSGCPAGEAAAGTEGQFPAAGGSAARVQQNLWLRPAPARLRRQLCASPHAETLPRCKGNLLAVTLFLWSVWRVVLKSFLSHRTWLSVSTVRIMKCFWSTALSQQGEIPKGF